MTLFPDAVPATFVEAPAYDSFLVMTWLHERGGDELAHAWLWSCTPWPFAFPNAEQVEEGLQVAAGELSIADLMERVEASMRHAMEQEPK